MNHMVKRFIEVLEEDVKHWEEAATACDSIVPFLVGNDQKKQWSATAEEYRARARTHKALIELAKTDHV